MSKYFNNENVREIDNDDVFTFMRRPDKHPEKFIRIAVDEEIMCLNYKDEHEYDLCSATVFLWTSPCEVMRYDFDCENDDNILYLAVDENNGLALTTDYPDQSLEGLGTFGKNEGLFGIFRTEEETIFITYDGTMKKIGYSVLHESPDAPAVADQMDLLFALFYSDESEEDEENIGQE